LEQLAQETAQAGKFLEQRLTIYPEYTRQSRQWLDPAVRPAVLKLSDAEGFAKRDSWSPGEEQPLPVLEATLLNQAPLNQAATTAALDIKELVARCVAKIALTEAELARLLQSRGPDFAYVCRAADALRQEVNGEVVTYVVNRNVNYTNVCSFKCQFCAFSKGKHSEDLRGDPYDISAEELARRCQEAWQRGATEVCLQGGIHPDYTGQTYLDILRTIRAAAPGLHIHAFSPLEVWQGAATLGITLDEFLYRLRAAGLDTLPGTAAEVLHDEVRAELCPDKLTSAQWLAVMEAAHRAGFKTTATLMYGHIEEPRHWAAHLVAIRELQRKTGGFTEFVPLPYVHMEAPLYRKGRSRKGPSFREAVLLHAVARLALHGVIGNIQTSWVKMGRAGVAACLNAGANDLGGTLMNESITRAAGAEHGQEWPPQEMERLIHSLGRSPRMRTTLYQDAPAERRAAAFAAAPLEAMRNAAAGKYQRGKLLLVSEDVIALTPSSACGGGLGWGQ
jgi:FO synthase